MSSVFLAPLDDIELAIPTLTLLVERRNLGQALEVACLRIEDQSILLDRLEQLVSTSDLVAEHLQGAQREAVQSHLQVMWSIGANSSRAESREDLESITREVPALKERMREIERFLLAAWQQRTQDEFAAAESLGSVLKEISDGETLRLIGEMMLHASKQGIACSKVLPVSLGSREQFNKAIEERDAAYALLTDSGADAEVVNFLNAVAKEKASLSDVTPAVFTWLQERKATQRFRVNL